jgi:DNA-directed RNA polymerase subunit RPC12/RpoP
MESVMKLTCIKCQNEFEIDDDVEQFACAGCGTQYIVKRTGGMVRLAQAPKKDSRAVLRREIEELEHALKSEMECELGGMPGYQLLRFDYAKIGKLHLQFATVAPEKILANIFETLTINELERIASLYASNPGSPTRAWILRMRDLRVNIEEKKNLLAKESLDLSST